MPAHHHLREFPGAGWRSRPAPRRPLCARRAKPATSHRLLTGIALVLVVLLPLQNATAAMARLWRSAHYHPSLFTTAAEMRSPERSAEAAYAGVAVAEAAATAVLDAPRRPAPPALLPQPVVESALRHPHPHPHAHAHADQQDAGRASAPRPHPLAAGVGAAEQPLPADDHRTQAAHAEVHAVTGVGRHRHDRDDPDVVYVDDGDAPDPPATVPRLQLDGSMLLPTPLSLPGIAATADGMPRSRAAPLRAHFAVPPDRPPR